jgi:hypothetical protein
MVLLASSENFIVDVGMVRRRCAMEMIYVVVALVGLMFGVLSMASLSKSER